MSVIGFKGAKCKNCYKCVRNCKVKSIMIKDETAQIMDDHCILCGKCLEVCPQNAKYIKSDLEQVKEFIREGKRVVISMAPSYLGLIKFKDPRQVITALMKLGFSQIRETSEGAAYVTHAYQKLLEEGKMDNIITTCCPAANDLIEMYFPSLTKYMAPVVSPMIAHGRLIKEELGADTKVVFLGPCIAKKKEALEDIRCQGAIDAVLNFTELEQWLAEENIVVSEQESTDFHNANPRVNRLYPVTNGVIQSVMAGKSEEEKRKDGYRKFYVHGVENCMELFKGMEQDEVHGCFIEVNICTGGCVKGPAVRETMDNFSRFRIKLDMEEDIPKEPVREEEYTDLKKIDIRKEFLDCSPKEKMPTEEEIREILLRIGKTKKSDELNCGACGYPSCRDKAIATYQGKAEWNMCIPYMHDRAESLSNVVLDASPNMIIIVDKEMKIVEFSHAAEKYFKVARAKALDMYLYEIINHADFEYVYNTHTSIIGKKITYPEYKLTTLQIIVYVPEQDYVLGIFQNISDQEETIKKNYQIKMDTIDMAQKIIDKQMMVAQEIAGLLGETTAETKVTLNKLRDTIINDGEQ
ncbi:MAG: [Fe-Fe] hydrogenase large subunit C-terminal domain-containing protein [Lachnospiraceae bacterium]